MKYRELDDYEMMFKLLDDLRATGVDGFDVFVDNGPSYRLSDAIRDIEMDPNVKKDTIKIVGTVIDERPSEVKFHGSEIRIMYCITWSYKKKE